MGPGPGNPYPEVAAAFARPLLGHLDPVFLDLLDETNDRLRQVFQTTNPLTFPVSGTGSAGMQAALVNTVRPGDVVVVGVNGVFGERLCDAGQRCGAEVVRVEAPWASPIDQQALLDAHPSPAAIAVVHAETSTGVRNDIDRLGEHKGDALLVVDCVTSLGGIPFEADGWSIDVAYSGTQKCLGVPPGLSPFTVSPAAMDRVPETPSSWYFDLNQIARYVTGDQGRAYHHTAPVAMIYALHAGLGALLDEGLRSSFDRHLACGERLQSELEKRGFELCAAEGHRLPQLTSVRVPSERLPAAMTEADVRRLLLDRYSIEIGGGLGPFAGEVWRIGLMGHTARPRNVELLLGALDEILEG